MTAKPADKADDETNSPTPQDSPDLAALKKQVALAEQRQKLIEATLPSKVEPLKGETKIDGDNPIEGFILAYKALDALAARIAAQVHAVQPQRVVIHSDALADQLIGYQAFMAQLDLIERQIDDEIANARALLAAKLVARRAGPTVKLFALTGPAALAGLVSAAAPFQVAKAGIASAIELLALFRVDTELKYKDVAIKDEALIAALAGKLVQNNVAVYDPARLPPNLAGAPPSAVLAKLDDLRRARDRLDAVQTEIKQEIDKAAAEVERLKKAVGETDQAEDEPAETEEPAADKLVWPGLEHWAKHFAQAHEYPLDLPGDLLGDEETADAPAMQLKAAQTRLAALKDADANLTAGRTAFTALQAALAKSDEASGATALSKILRAEKLAAIAAGAHWLWLKAGPAGGGVQTRRYLWGIFPSIRYSGGAVVEFILFDAQGKIVKAGLLPGYTGFLNVAWTPWRVVSLANVDV